MTTEPGVLQGYVVDLSELKAEKWAGKRYDTETGEPLMLTVKLPVRQMLIDCLFNPALQISVLNGGIVARRVADRILDSATDSVTLTQEEWQHLKDAVSSYPGFAHHELSVVDRVLEAKETALKPEA